MWRADFLFRAGFTGNLKNSIKEPAVAMPIEAAIEEEKLTRSGSTGLPENAIRFCLESAGAPAGQAGTKEVGWTTGLELAKVARYILVYDL